MSISEQWKHAVSAIVVLTGSVAGLACSEPASDEVRTVAQAQSPAWAVGTSYSPGDLVVYDSVTYRCVQGHVAQSGWNPASVPALWEVHDEGQTIPSSPPTSSLPVNPTIKNVVVDVDCRQEPENCCPEGSTPNLLTDNPDVLQILTPNECVIAGHGSDTLMVSSDGPSALHLGPGDDTAMDGPGDNLIFAGDGRDTINAHGGTNLFFAGAGDDTVMAANGQNTVVPGPGRDTVALGTGDDTLHIFDVCEVSSGETLSGGGGQNTLVSPVPLSELQALGVTVTNFQNVVIEPRSCWSECTDKPDCSGNGSCVEVDGSPGDMACFCERGWVGEACDKPFNGDVIDKPAGVARSALDAYEPNVLGDISYVPPGSPFPGSASLPPIGGGSGVIGALLPAQDPSCNTVMPPEFFVFKVTKLRGGTDGGPGDTESRITGRIDILTESSETIGDRCTDTNCPSFSALVPPVWNSVFVHLDVIEKDKFLNGSDDDELDIDLNVDNTTGEWEGDWKSKKGGDSGVITPDTNCVKTDRGFELCWAVESVTQRPRFCPQVTAQFIDAGRGETVLAETLPDSNLQAVPASFAYARVSVESGSTQLGCFEGYLDQDGCVPSENLFPRAYYRGVNETGFPLTITTTVRGILCKDGSGRGCEMISCPADNPNCGNRKGAMITIGKEAGVAASDPSVLGGKTPDVAEVCQVHTEDPSKVVPGGCFRDVEQDFISNEVRQIDERLEREDSGTSALATIATILAEEARGKDLGIEESFTGSPEYKIFVDNPCPHSLDEDGETIFTAYAGEDHMCLEGSIPGRPKLGDEITSAADPNYKFVMAHEIGHVVQMRGSLRLDRSKLAGDRYDFERATTRWGCSHIDEDIDGNKLHCLQGIEQSNAAIEEGFGHFFAAEAFNADSLNVSCRFNYYKASLLESCRVDPSECVFRADGLVVNPAPVPFSCNEVVKHRNKDPNLPARVATTPWEATTGTEWDWMLFFRAVNLDLGFSMKEILDVYAGAVSEYGTTFDGTPAGVPRTGPLQPAGSLLDSVESLQGDIVRETFNARGDKYGVSTDLTPP